MRAFRYYLIVLLTLPTFVQSARTAPLLRSSRPAYNVGETVELTVDGASGPVSVRFGFAGGSTFQSAKLEPGKWSRVWTVPQNAQLGLYEAVVASDPSGALTPAGTASKDSSPLPVVIYRQDLAVENLRTERNLYTAGDVVRVRVRLKNLSPRPLQNLKLVIGRGYPWISGFGRGSAISGDPSAQVYYYPRAVNLTPGQVFESDWFDTMTAGLPTPDKPDVFNMFCWISDSSGKDLYDLELTGTFVVVPPGYRGPLPYHPLYALYKFLSDSDYRGASYRDPNSYSDEIPGGAPTLHSWMGFAPHYDDELSFFPLVPISKKNNVPFYIVQMTAGDGNVDSIHRYVDGVSNAPDWHTLGRLRRFETVHAASIFGLQEGRDFTHLGMPDGGLLPIFEDTSGKNFYMFTTASDHTPYDFVFHKNLPYNREEIIKTLVELIRQRKPEDIYTPHPDEGHGDHRTTTWFVLEALRRLRAENGYAPRVHVYVAYGAGDFPKAKYQYEAEPPLRMSDRTLVKMHFASWAYQSQFSIAERGGNRLPLEELRKHPEMRWYLLKGW